MQLYQQNADRKIAKIRPELQKPEFTNVVATSSSDGQVYLLGTVASEQSYKALKERVQFLFGDEESSFMARAMSRLRAR